MAITSAQVKEIINTTEEELTAFIATAEELVDALLGSSDLSEDRLDSIKKYVAAHFITIKDKQLESERIGDVEQRYQSVTTTGEGLSLTPYGQTAILLDTTSTLRKLGTEEKVESVEDSQRIFEIL